MAGRRVSRSRTRLVRTKEKDKRQTFFYIFLSLLLVGVVAYFGLPLLIKLAVFLGDLKRISDPAIDDDRIAPMPPVFLSLPTATKSAELRIEGYVEPGAEVEIFLNDVRLEQLESDDEGRFELEKVRLDEGENLFWALAIDVAGNKSEKSRMYAVLVDGEPPELVIDNPVDGEVIELATGTIKLVGKVGEAEKLTVNDRQIVLGSEGDFSSMYSLQEGDNELIFIAVDEAGNETIQNLKVKWEKP